MGLSRKERFEIARTKPSELRGPRAMDFASFRSEAKSQIEPRMRKLLFSCELA